jgi:hypothetical protein
MEAEIKHLETPPPLPKSLSYEPVLLGAGALMLGYVIGSGKWDWLARSTGKIVESLGSLALDYLSHSFQEQNPQLFRREQKIVP